MPVIEIAGFAKNNKYFWFVHNLSQVRASVCASMYVSVCVCVCFSKKGVLKAVCCGIFGI